MRTWEPPVPERRRPHHAPAGPVHPLLGLQRTAGNRAVQRYVSQHVTHDAEAEAARDGSTSGRDVAVVYVTERDSTAEHALPAQWSAGTQRPADHAERVALGAARRAGYAIVGGPGEAGKRVVRLYTELKPCGDCEPWLEGVLMNWQTVQWTAPHAASTWWWEVPNTLWQSRVAQLSALHSLRAGVRSSPAAARAWQAAHDQIIGVDLRPDTWHRHGDEETAIKAAQAEHQVWVDAVQAVRDALAPAPPPLALPPPTPAPPPLPPPLALPLPPPTSITPVVAGPPPVPVPQPAAKRPASARDLLQVPPHRPNRKRWQGKGGHTFGECTWCHRAVRVNQDNSLRRHKRLTGEWCTPPPARFPNW